MRAYESQSNTAFLLVLVGGLGLRSDHHARHNFALRFGAANSEQPLRKQQHKSTDFYTRCDSTARDQRSWRDHTESDDTESNHSQPDHSWPNDAKPEPQQHISRART